ncbi:MAG: hypothetical protein IH602_04150 [Bryobacteraceae bacterium]|nr:hypothetical protein [Bryobacteraceae bacterium]
MNLSKLTNEDMTVLRREGVVFRGEWFFAPSLIPDCDLRLKMASYFAKVIQGQTDVPVSRFGWLNSSSVASVTEHVWLRIGSVAIPSDGNFTNEAWALLEQPWIPSKVLTRIVKRELRRGGLSPGAVYLLLLRPLPDLEGDLRELAVRPKRNEPVFEAASALVLLNILGDKSSLKGIGELVEIANPLERGAIMEISAKMLDDRPVLWPDLEKLLADW